MATHYENGVTIYPMIPSSNVKITYQGLLYQNGAAEVYAHVGQGADWQNTHDYPMHRTAHGFEVSVPFPKASTLNICFKDNANNWDNNAGANYSVTVEGFCDNSALEASEEIGIVSMCKNAINRWFGASD